MGYANPDAMRAGMPVRVYLEWVRFLANEPLPEDKADWRAAMAAFTMASIWRGEKGRKPKFADFLPEWSKASKEGRRPRRRGPMNALRAMVNFATLFGGKIEDRRSEHRKQRDGTLEDLLSRR